MSQINRINGSVGDLAVKAPCDVCATINIVTEGFPVVDGYQTKENDRVLLTAQADSKDNGIYIVGNSWARSTDFNGAGDITCGTEVRVCSGTSNHGVWHVATANPIVIGQSSIVFAKDTFSIETSDDIVEGENNLFLTQNERNSIANIFEKRKYAFKSDGVDSLAHLATGFSSGDAFYVDYFDIGQQIGSNALWRIVDVLGTPATSNIGNVIDNATYGAVMQGVNYLFQFQAENGELDFSKLGINLTGVSGQHSKIDRLIASSLRRSERLTGKGTFHATETIDFQKIKINQPDILYRPHMNGISRSTYSASGTPVGFVPFYTGSESGVETINLPDDDGVTRTYGILAKLGGNMDSNSLPLDQNFFFHGDGNFDHSRHATCAVVARDADSPLDSFTFRAAYGYGVVLGGSFEVQRVYVGTSNCTISTFIESGSQDELVISIDSKQDNLVFGMAENSDCSVTVDINAENFGGKGTLSPVSLNHGKYFWGEGFLRGHNDTSGLGIPAVKSWRNGTFPPPYVGLEMRFYRGRNRVCSIERAKTLSGIFRCERGEIQDNYVGESYFLGAVGQVQTGVASGGTAGFAGIELTDNDMVTGILIGNSTYAPVNTRLPDIVITKNKPGQTRVIGGVSYDDIAINMNYGTGNYLPVKDCIGDVIVGSNWNNNIVVFDHFVGDITIESGASGTIQFPANYAGTITNNSTTIRLIKHGDNGTGQGVYTDTQYTTGSPFSITGGVKTALPNNKGTVDETQLPFGVTTMYDGNVIKGENGDGRLIEIRYKIRPTMVSSNYVDTMLDIGSGTPIIVTSKTEVFVKGVGVVHSVVYSVNAYNRATWQANGAKVYVQSDGPCEIFDIQYVITKTHDAR